jgi:hypothetical protein
VLSTAWSSSGGSGEGRLGVGVIPARGCLELGWIKLGVRGGGEEAKGQRDLVGVEGSRWMPARNEGGFRCREKKEKAKQPGRGGSIGFCSSARLVEEKERERERSHR